MDGPPASLSCYRALEGLNAAVGSWSWEQSHLSSIFVPCLLYLLPAFCQVNLLFANAVVSDGADLNAAFASVSSNPTYADSCEYSRD